MNVIRDTTAGGNIGAAIGQGLGAGLQALAEHRLQTAMSKRQQNQKKQGLKALGMFDDSQVEGLSKLPDNLLSDVLKGVYKNQYQASPGQPGQEGQQDTSQSDYLLGNPQRPQPTMQQQISSGQQQTQMPGQPTIEQTIASGQKPIEPQLPKGLELLTKGKGLSQTPDLMTNKGAQDVIAATRKQAPRMAPKRQELAQATQAETAQPSVTRAPASIKTIMMGHKENKPFLDELTKNAKEARENNMRLERIEQLDKTGNLQNPVLAGVLETLHLDYPALMSKESQELKKLSSDFVKGAKAIFGSRITNADLKVFMNTVPTLSQTKEGRQAVIRNWKLMNKGVVARERAANDIIEENGGVAPIGLKAKVEKRIASELASISKEFVFGEQSDYKVGQKINSLPKNPKVGMIIETDKGEDLVWNGKNWSKSKKG